MICISFSQSSVDYRMAIPGCDRLHSGSLQIKIQDKEVIICHCEVIVFQNYICGVSLQSTDDKNRVRRKIMCTGSFLLQGIT